MIDTARDRSGHDQLALETQHPIPCTPEHSIAPLVRATAPTMIATIDFDYQRDSESQEVDDVVPDDRLPAKRNPRAGCPATPAKAALQRAWGSAAFREHGPRAAHCVNGMDETMDLRARQ
jgi:hypothetical protein